MTVKKIMVTEGIADDPLRTMIAQFNALLAKLDGDAGVSSTDYKATLKIQDSLTNTDI